MKKYFTISAWLSLLQKLGKEKQRIISPHLLQAASGLSREATAKAIQRLSRRGYLIKLYKKSYAVKFAPPSLEEIAMVYGKPCYISFESALENYGIISQVPLVLTCATTRKIKNIRTPFGEIIFHHIQPYLFNNFKNESGIFWAAAEKALLDFLYVNLKSRGILPPLNEFNLTALNKKQLKKLAGSFPRSVKNALKQLGLS